MRSLQITIFAILLACLWAAPAPADTYTTVDGKACTCKKHEPGTFASKDSVWSGNREKSYTPYLKFAKTEFPKAAKAVPTFDTIYFDLDKSNLRPASVAVLNEVFAYMDTHPKAKILIEGHCCDWGTDAYNMKLGQRRADAAKTYLVDKGIVPARIKTISYGERRPAYPNKGPKRPLNRRDELKIRIVKPMQ